MTPQEITFCGCGWLARHFIKYQKPASVLGTTTSVSRFNELEETGVKPFHFALGNDQKALMQRSGTNPVVINIPPGARKNPLSPTFVPAMKALIDGFINAGCERLIFISTTAVYGNIDGVISEHSQAIPETDSGKAHVEIENHLLSVNHPAVHIIRLSGLTGIDRHPVKFLAGRTLSQGEQAVNLVHVEDVSRALNVLLNSKDIFPGLMHLNALKQPRRDEYYTWCAAQMGLPEPVFEGEHKMLSGKQIDASASWEALGLTPIYASPYDMLEGVSLS